MNPDLLFKLALTDVPKIGHIHANTLLSHFGTAEAVFAAPVSKLERLPGISTTIARNIRSFKNFEAAEAELRFIEKYKIETLCINDEKYPRRLKHCEDPPIMLFYRGNIDLNSERMIAIIGTRSSTEYGRMLTDKLVKALQEYNVVIVSGLAFGIDVYAHKAAIRYNIPTIGVLGHGLDTLYPPEHSSIAKTMIKNGGLLSEFK
ncbi:MAG: DNA-protecting protein DprA, partial [Chitinophagaceae bacterium]